MRFLVLFLILLVCFSGCSDSLEKQETLGYPRIYVNQSEKEPFLESVGETEWKQDLVRKKKEGLGKYLALYQEDSTWLVSRLQMNWKTNHSNVYLTGGDFSYSDGEAPVPTVRYSGTRDWATDYLSPKLEDIQPYLDDKRGIYIQRKNTKEWEWVKPSETGHIIEGINRRIMGLVADAAFLYWLTGEEKYAEFAAPVFFQYMEGMFYRNPPIVLGESNQIGISGLATFEVIHEKIVIHLATTFDFLHNYFVEKGESLEHSEAVFQKWGDQIIENGIPDNNWNLFQARFLTYIAIVLEDDSEYENGKGRQYYLENTFDVSSERQIALKESMMVYDQGNGIWPESASYSMHVTTTLLEILTLLDHFTNDNELANYPIVEKAALAAFQYLFPSGYNVGFGDSHHNTIPPENFELLIANYRKYDESEKELIISKLLSQLIEKRLYKRKGNNLFNLFFYVDSIKATSSTPIETKLITPTFYAPNVSLFVQRLGEGDQSMMIATVGSYGNHSHVNGVSIELFANNYVLGPDMGRGPSYWHEDHRRYYSRFPAHNTVVVDGISDYDAMRGYHPFALDNSFPKSEELPLFDKVTYSKVSFFEPKTKSDQQRLTAMIKTKSGQGYALDIFRSKKVNNGSQKHDYFYHNLGQSLEIYNNDGKPVALKKTTDLGSKYGELRAYDYFTDKRKKVIDQDFSAVFTLKSEGQPDNLMKLWVKGNKGQQVYKINGPKSNALSSGTAPEEIREAKVPTLMLRRNESAWNNPYVLLFNPYMDDKENAIVGVDFDENGIGGQKIQVSTSDGSKDIILAGASKNSVIETDNHYQKGLLSITRHAEKSKTLDFIFASGIYQLRTSGWEIIASKNPLTLSIEKQDNGFMIQNDGPLLLRIPASEKLRSATMQIFEDGELVSEKKGIVSRHNTNQIEFRLERSFEKALIILN